ncbi:MAG: OmpH family outer membrane protein [Omnitrophica bacterium]|nr:OmpH family outer membrane protein [Candidatus Omnitrophota bacterium]
MRKIFSIILILGLTISVSFTCFSKELKIGYVNIIKVFNEYQKTKDYEAQLNEKKKKVEKKLSKKREEIEKLNSKLSLLKEEEKNEYQDKIQEKIKEHQEIAREAQVDMKKIVIEQMTEIKKDMDKIIENYAKKKGFNLIVDGNSVLYAAKAMDVTEDILKISNKQYKKKK